MKEREAKANIPKHMLIWHQSDMLSAKVDLEVLVHISETNNQQVTNAEKHIDKIYSGFQDLVKSEEPFNDNQRSRIKYLRSTMRIDTNFKLFRFLSKLCDMCISVI